MTISTAYPDLLQNGNPADATQVMANFYQIQNDVNANAAANGANSDITSLTGLTTALSIGQGGTGANTAAAALLALGAAASGANSDITSLAGLLTPLSIAQGGTAASTAVGALASLGAAPLASPTFTGSPAAPTPTAGDSTTLLATTAFVTGGIATAVAGIPFSESYTSSQTAFTAGSVTTFNHGLSAVPKLVVAELVCTTADLDYSVGDHVFLASWIYPSSENYGSTVSYNTTAVNVTIGSNGYYISYKSGTNKSLITVGSWRILVKAFA